MGDCIDYIFEALGPNGLFLVRFNAADDNENEPVAERWPDGRMHDDKSRTVGQWRMPIKWLKNIATERKQFEVVLEREFQYLDHAGAEIFSGLGRVYEIVFRKVAHANKDKTSWPTYPHENCARPKRAPLPAHAKLREKQEHVDEKILMQAYKRRQTVAEQPTNKKEAIKPTEDAVMEDHLSQGGLNLSSEDIEDPDETSTNKKHVQLMEECVDLLKEDEKIAQHYSYGDNQ